MDARPTLPHTNPMESGPGHTFSAQNRKQTKRFMIFDPKTRGVIFLTFLTPPTPTPTPLPQKLKKEGLNCGESSGVRTKNSLANVFIGQNNDFTRR